MSLATGSPRRTPSSYRPASMSVRSQSLKISALTVLFGSSRAWAGARVISEAFPTEVRAGYSGRLAHDRQVG